jgi:hypothetical protein
MLENMFVLENKTLTGEICHQAPCHCCPLTVDQQSAALKLVVKIDRRIPKFENDDEFENLDAGGEEAAAGCDGRPCWRKH